MKRIHIKSAIKCLINGPQKVEVNVNNIVLAPNDILAGKTAVITGAGSGIGEAISKAYISCGATVVGIGRTKRKLENVKKEIGSDRFIPFVYDVSNVENLSNTITSIAQHFHNDKIDILVNCAGVKNGNDERFFEFTPTDFDYVVDTNLKATFFWCQEMAKFMIAHETKGHIVNVISIKGFIGEASPYSVSKWGCVSLTKGLGRLLAPKGIVVNGIAPGGTRTPMAKEHSLSWVHTATPSLRLADPNEMANIAVFLGSELGNNIVGDVIISDGGQSLCFGNNNKL